MVNHLRTLLLNAGRATGTPYIAGEQVVSRDFRARILPPELRIVRDLLLGNGDDLYYLNWRLQELLTCVHTSPLVEYATAIDRRITYWPFDTSLMEKCWQSPTYTKTAGNTNLKIYFSGEKILKVGFFELYCRWTIRHTGTTTLAFDTYDFAGRLLETSAATYTIASGLTSDITLPFSSLKFRFDADAAAAWSVEAIQPPVTPFAVAFAAFEAHLPAALKASLFDGGEPYATFRNVWDTSPDLPARVAAVVLALGQRLAAVEA